MKQNLVSNNTNEDIHLFFIFHSTCIMSNNDSRKVKTSIRLCEDLVQDNHYFESTLSLLLINSSLYKNGSHTKSLLNNIERMK